MIHAIIQARMGSTRLPGKVLLPLGEKTILEHVVERTRKASSIHEVIVVTSNLPEDLAIVDLCKKKSIAVYQGSSEDVLDRYYQCAQSFGIQTICRITGDCPLVESSLIDRAAMYCKEYEYISTAYPCATFPDGLDVEILTFNALERAWKEARLASEREHVTPYIWKNPSLFKIFTLKSSTDISKYRFTIDHMRDYVFLKKIFEYVKPLSVDSIIDFLKKNPAIMEINHQIERNEGYEKSLINDHEI